MPAMDADEEAARARKARKRKQERVASAYLMSESERLSLLEEQIGALASIIRYRQTNRVKR